MTPAAVMLQKFCMLKGNNLDPWEGGGVPGYAPSRSANVTGIFHVEILRQNNNPIYVCVME